MSVDQAIIDKLIHQSELDSHGQDLMRQYFKSIAQESNHDKIVDLLERFPSVFENFCQCFALKSDFLKKGGTDEQWGDLMRARS